MTTDMQPTFPLARPPLLSPFQMFALMGCLIVLGGSFLPFCQFPIENHTTWFGGGTGTGAVVGLCTIATGVLILFRHLFLPTCYVFFAGFFLCLEILIAYDTQAIKAGTETIKEAKFRSVLEIYGDAFSPGYGALWIALGLCLILVMCIVMFLQNHFQETRRLDREIARSQESTDAGFETSQVSQTQGL